MVAALYKAVVELPPLSGLPEDTINNTFYFDSNSADSTADDATSIKNRLVSFYNDIPAGDTKQISDILSSAIARTTNASKVLVYQKTGLITAPIVWGSPVATLSWTLGVSDTGASLPSEVSIVASFHGDLTDVPETQANPTPPPAIIRPAARKRGRIYLGPLNADTGLESSSTGDLELKGSIATMICRAMTDLEADNGSIGWVVYSAADGANSPVVGGYVDNAYDTQRRRGVKSSSRTVWTA